MSDLPDPLDPSFLICVREWLERVPNPACILDGAGRVWWANGPWEASRLLGSVGAHLPTVWSEVESPRLAWMIQDVLAGSPGADVRIGPLSGGGRSGWFQVEAICLPLDEEDPCAVVQVREVDGLVDLVHRLQHENEQMQRRLILLEQLSERDPETGLLDRRGLERALARELDHIDRADSGGRSGLLRIRLHGFDRLDEGQRKRLTRHLSVALAANLRPRDEAAVLENGDFAVLLPDQRPQDVERVRAEMGRNLEVAVRAAGADDLGIRTSATPIDRTDARVRDILERSERGLDGVRGAGEATAGGFEDA